MIVPPRLPPTRYQLVACLVAVLAAAPAAAAVWNVSTVGELDLAMSHLGNQDTVILSPGTYRLNHGYYVTQSGITIRGATGSAGDVILNGGGMNNSSDVSRYECISLVGTDNTIMDLSIEEFYHHALHFQPGADRAHIRNVTTRNIGEQHMKGAKYNAYGVIENCLLEQTYPRTNDGVARPDNYTGGVDLLGADNWIVRNNLIRDIEGISGGGAGILLWQDITNCTVENNVIVGCAAGLHLGNTGVANGVSDSVARNNFLVAVTNADDAPLSLAFTKNVEVYNNAIFGAVPGGTFWFTMVQVYDTASTPTENLQLRNNLIRGRVWDRSVGDWSTAAVEAMGNLVDTTGGTILPEWFANALSGDLHLLESATGAIGQGTVLEGAPWDFDGQWRGPIGQPCDLGADQRIAAEPIPGDANLDGIVFDLDASILAAHWQMTSGAGWTDGDFDANGRVDDLDASILAAHWQEGVGSASVPEPSALALLLAAAAATLLFCPCRSRRRTSID